MKTCLNAIFWLGIAYFISFVLFVIPLLYYSSEVFWDDNQTANFFPLAIILISLLFILAINIAFLVLGIITLTSNKNFTSNEDFQEFQSTLTAIGILLIIGFFLNIVALVASIMAKVLAHKIKKIELKSPSTS